MYNLNNNDHQKCRKFIKNSNKNNNNNNRKHVFFSILNSCHSINAIHFQSLDGPTEIDELFYRISRWSDTPEREWSISIAPKTKHLKPIQSESHFLNS